MRTIHLLLGTSLIAGLTACGGSGTTSPSSPAVSQAAPAAVASGNGIADKKPEEVLASTRAALAAASSVRIKGTLPPQSAPTAIDLQLGKGSTGRGTLTRNKEKMELLRRGTVVFVRGNAAFYPAGAPKGVEKMYLRTTTQDPKVADFAQLLDLKAVSENIVPKSTTGLTLGAQVTVGGVPAVPLKAKDTTVLVSAVGEPRPLQITSDDGGRVDLEYDVPVEVAEPAAKDVIDLG